MEVHITMAVHFGNEADEQTVNRMVQQMGDRAFHRLVEEYEITLCGLPTEDGEIAQVSLEVDDPEVGGRVEGIITEAKIYARRWCQLNRPDMNEVTACNVYARPDPSECNHPEASVKHIESPPHARQETWPMCGDCGDIL